MHVVGYCITAGNRGHRRILHLFSSSSANPPVCPGVRHPRIIKHGATYHVVARANRQEFILESRAVKELLLRTLVRAKSRYRFELVSLCVMGNHFHMMIKPGPGESLSRIMQWILSVFAIRFNLMFGLRGHVWYDRFRSKVIAGLRHFLATLSYISLNPVRAGIVDRAEDYPYATHRFERDGPPGLIDPPDRVIGIAHR